MIVLALIFLLLGLAFGLRGLFTDNDDLIDVSAAFTIVSVVLSVIMLFTGIT